MKHQRLLNLETLLLLHFQKRQTSENSLVIDITGALCTMCVCVCICNIVCELLLLFIGFYFFLWHVTADSVLSCIIVWIIKLLSLLQPIVYITSKLDKDCYICTMCTRHKNCIIGAIKLKRPWALHIRENCCTYVYMYVYECVCSNIMSSMYIGSRPGSHF